jgi:hypothetical protein
MRKPVVRSREGREWLDSNNLLSRRNGPAVELRGGGKEWWIRGVHCRDQGPSIEWAFDGVMQLEWWFLGQLRMVAMPHDRSSSIFLVQTFDRFGGNPELEKVSDITPYLEETRFILTRIPPI